jgi:hypothetical protein
VPVPQQSSKGSPTFQQVATTASCHLPRSDVASPPPLPGNLCGFSQKTVVIVSYLCNSLCIFHELKLQIEFLFCCLPRSRVASSPPLSRKILRTAVKSRLFGRESRDSSAVLKILKSRDFTAVLKPGLFRSSQDFPRLPG